MSNSIRYFAETAKNAEHRRALTRMADMADQYRARVEAMPRWAKACGTDLRVPVSVKVEHDGLEVESWTSRRGDEMHRVHWLNGSTTQFTGDLSKHWVNYDHRGVIEYCVTYGFEGSGWTDGETFGSEDEAAEAFRSAVDSAPVDEHRYYVVTLTKRARTYCDGDIMTDSEIEKIMEERI